MIPFFGTARWSGLLPLLLAASVLSRTGSSQTQESPPDGPLAPQRIEQIAGWLPDRPRAVGRGIEDRVWWDGFAAAFDRQKIIASAEAALSKPMPELTDELYLDFSRTGNRTRWQDVARARHRRLPLLVLAECVENQGRFLPGIEKTLGALLDEKTWVMPAHDRGQRNFAGKTREIDLMVAMESWTLSTAAAWLGDRLNATSRARLIRELEERTFHPFEGMVRHGQPRLWWLTATNNWNAVCLAGVTGAALTMIDSKDRRAFFVAAAEKFIDSFLSGFTADGYCSEGIGYWNYGFGHFVALAETLHRATGGHVDLLANSRVAAIARFGRRMEIGQGVYPAFADCDLEARPAAALVAYLARCRGFDVETGDPRRLLTMVGPTTQLYQLGIFGVGCASEEAAPPSRSVPAAPLRDWFPEAGVYIGRPAAGVRGALGVALKGGHNAESHNHNDVGTFVVSLDGDMPLLDPGNEVYTRRTFSSKRYESRVLNSFGHPVPRVAGKLQRTGRNAAGKVLESLFDEKTDRIVLDLRSAYDVPELHTLRRSFEFSRQGRGCLTVSDEAAFETPQAFGTALVTFSPWRRIAPDRLLVGEEDARVLVEITTEPEVFDITTETIEEDLPRHRLPTRIGIDLREPTPTARIVLRISPAL